MVGLLEISPSFKTVEIQNKSIEVSGVSARGIAYLMGRFPEVKALFAQKSVDVSPERLVELVPDAIAAVIACGVGKVGDAETEKVAEGLPAGDQLELLAAILEVTMPRGAGPFVERLTGLAAAVNGGVSGTAPASISQPESKS
jgi:hypothetical protein